MLEREKEKHSHQMLNSKSPYKELIWEQAYPGMRGLWLEFGGPVKHFQGVVTISFILRSKYIGRWV